MAKKKAGTLKEAQPKDEKTLKATTKKHPVTGSVVRTQAPKTPKKAEDLKQVMKDEEDEDQDDKARMEKLRKDMRLFHSNDFITIFLKEKFNLAYLQAEYRYKDSRFPKDEKGHAMSVKRFYPSINLVMDELPTDWTQEMIAAKKWGVEQAGMLYIWRQEGENIQLIDDKMVLVEGGDLDEKALRALPDLYKSRVAKLRKKPDFKFQQHKFKPVFNGPSKVRFAS